MMQKMTHASVSKMYGDGLQDDGDTKNNVGIDRTGG